VIRKSQSPPVLCRRKVDLTSALQSANSLDVRLYVIESSIPTAHMLWLLNIGVLYLLF
jgi:hypothetical protein